MVELRNGEIHLGGRANVDDRVLVAFLRQIDACLQDLELTREKYWGEHSGIVEAFLSKESDRVKKLVAQKISQSQYQFKTFIAQYSDEVKEVILRGVPRPVIGEEPYPCPVCKAVGSALGDHEIGWEVDFYDDGEVENATETVNFIANGYRCNVCGLHLSSEEELAEAGLKIPETSSFDVNDIEPFEYQMAQIM